jgi:hypothetical protein
MSLPPEFLMCLNETQAAQQKLAEQQRDQSYQQQEPQQQGQNPFGQVCGLVGRNRKDERFKSSSSSGEREADQSFNLFSLYVLVHFIPPQHALSVAAAGWDTWVWWSSAWKRTTSSRDGKLDSRDYELGCPI